MVLDRVIGLTLAFVYIWNANHMQVEIVKSDVKFSNETDVIGIRAPTCHWPFPAMPYNQPIWFGLWQCSTMNHDVVWLFCIDCCESIQLLVGPPRLTSFVNRTHKNTVRFPFRLIRTACIIESFHNASLLVLLPASFLECTRQLAILFVRLTRCCSLPRVSGCVVVLRSSRTSLCTQSGL
jgi:hypothetical protein